MGRSNYNVEDFLTDESFQSFALDLNSEDKIYWLEWIGENPHKKNEFDEALSILTSFTFNTIQPDQHEFDTDLRRIEQTLKNRNKLILLVPKRTTFINWRIAASIAILAGVCIAVFQYVSYFRSQAEQIVIEKSTIKGQKLTFALPDGSQVKLNGGSHLKYEQNHLLRRRRVTLIGEAFFEVAKDSLNPFSVITKEVSTTALGTSFNVRANPDEKVIEISLVTGKVQIDNLSNSNGKSLVLLPGDGARYNGSNRQIISYKFNRDDVLAWRRGIIRFNNATIDEVVPTLERWYGVSIQVSNRPSESWRITGVFENESLENVMENISYTTKMDYKLDNKKLIIIF